MQKSQSGMQSVEQNIILPPPNISIAMACLVLRFQIACRNREPYVRLHEMEPGYLRPILALGSIVLDRFFLTGVIVPRFDCGKTNIRPLLMFCIWVKACLVLHTSSNSLFPSIRVPQWVICFRLILPIFLVRLPQFRYSVAL